MHPFLFGFWVCFGPVLVLLFLLSWVVEQIPDWPAAGTWASAIQIAMWILPILGLVVIFVLTRNKISHDFRGRIGISQLRGAIIGTLGSLLLLGCLLYADVLRVKTGIDSLKTTDPAELVE